MERYKRIHSSRTPAPSIQENEIRITTQGLSGGYISYASSLFQEKNVSEVVLTAMGRAINKAVTLAEILKRRHGNLHQNISLSSSYVKDVWEPLEEGLERLEMVRHVSMILITLSTKELDVSSCGYQPPTLTMQVQPLAESNQNEGGYRGGGRTRGRGFERRYMHSGNEYYHTGDENWNPGRGEYRGRGRGYDVGPRAYNNGYSQAENREFSKVNSLVDRRGQNNCYSSRMYTNTCSQGCRRGSNGYFSQGAVRHGNFQSNVNGHNQTRPDARGHIRSQRGFHQRNDEYGQGNYETLASDQNRTYQGQGGGSVGGRGRFRGRGRGRGRDR